MTGSEVFMASVLDALLGDPDWFPHPVRIMGRCIAWCDRRVRAIAQRAMSLRLAGGCLAMGLPLLVYVVGAAMIDAAEHVAGWLGSALTIGLAWTTIAARDLWDHACAVQRLLAIDNIPAARRAVAMIVGRDTAELPAAEIARATVETVAESTADGVIAPLFYLAIGGAPLALAYKAVSTLDSMIGHRDARYVDFGWASARLDDLANWIPARVAAGLLIIGAWLVTGQPARVLNGWRVFWCDGHKHPSPNSGRPEAAMAGVLGVRLGGVNVYAGVAQERPVLGHTGREPVSDDITLAAHIMAAAAGIGVFLAGVSKWLV